MSKKSHRRKQDDRNAAPSHEQERRLHEAEHTLNDEAADFDESAEEFTDLFDPGAKHHEQQPRPRHD